MEAKQKILIVEDDEVVRAGLVDLLTYHCYDVTCASDGEAGTRLALSAAFDLVIIDIGLPRRDGFSLCKAVRNKDEDVALIALTARSDEKDVIEGFSLGVDDYVVKPFSIHQLMHRIRAVLRRKTRGGRRDDYPEEFNLGTFLRVMPAKLQARLLNQTSGQDPKVTLTKKEAEILKYLFRNNRRPVPRSELLARLWQHRPGSLVETRTVDIHIAKLRRKIEPNPASPQFLITVRAEGYQLINAEPGGS